MSPNIHILFIDQQPTKFAGGQERSLYELCTDLSGRQGVKVSLIWQEKGELLDKYREFCSTDFRVPHRQLQFHTLPSLVMSLSEGLIRNISQRWDMVYANQYFDIPFAAALSKVTGLPLVCHLRLLCPHYLSRQYRWGLEHASMLIANSRATRDSYVEAGISKEKMEIVHNRVDVEKFSPASPAPVNETPVITYLGRLCPEKGIEELIQAAHLLGDNGYRLELYGDVRGAGTSDNYLDQLHEQAGDLWNKTIYFYPHTSDVVPALHQSDLMVLPSHMESFGRVLLEAMACEVPVVATRVGGVPEVLGAGFEDQMVDSQNPEQLAAKIKEYLNWREDKPELGPRSRNWVRNYFSADTYADEILSVVRRMIMPRFKRTAATS